MMKTVIGLKTFSRSVGFTTSMFQNCVGYILYYMHFVYGGVPDKDVH